MRRVGSRWKRSIEVGDELNPVEMTAAKELREKEEGGVKPPLHLGLAGLAEDV